jgi:hypothetical protein
MRAPRLCRAAATTTVVALLASLAVLPADAKKKKKKKKKKDDDIVDVSAWKDKFIVYTDGDDGYYAAVPGEMDAVFYGDGKTFYKQRTFSGGRSPPKWSFRMWSPRVNSVADLDGSDDSADKVGTMTCGEEEFELTKIDAKEAAKIIDKATFKAPLWKRQAHKLSRDDRGTYYYVDRLRDDVTNYEKKGWRLFAGQKGAMKELPLTNIVSDSEGEIFSSKRGELRFIQENDKATWIKGERKTELVNVPVEDNVKMIYGELGVYEGSLGTPCDEF